MKKNIIGDILFGIGLSIIWGTVFSNALMGIAFGSAFAGSAAAREHNKNKGK